MKMKGWAARTMGRLEESFEMFICGCVKFVLVGLAEEETASWGGLEKFCRQDTTEPERWISVPVKGLPRVQFKCILYDFTLAS